MNTNQKPSLIDVYEDLLEFKETRESVTELIKMRKALIDNEHFDFEKINEAEGKAMKAIYNLFAED